MSEPKTASGKRTIPLGRTTMDALRAHRSIQVAERLRLGPVWNDEDLVFASHTGALMRSSGASLATSLATTADQPEAVGALMPQVP